MPARLVPIRLPWTRLPVLAVPSTSRPYWALPLRTLAAPSAVPPTVLLETSTKARLPPPNPTVPAALVPKRLPWMSSPLPERSSTPVVPLPAKTLPAPAAVPPIVTKLEDSTSVSNPAAGSSAVPAAFRPTVLP